MNAFRLAATLLVFTGHTAFADIPAQVEVIYVVGNVFASHPSNGVPYRVVLGSNVSFGNTVQTSPDSSVRLKFPDGSLILLDPKSTMTLEEVSHSEENGLKARLKLAAGALWANVLKIGKRPDVRVVAGGSVIGVRGTNFSVDAGDGKSVDVSVAEGAVVVEEPTVDGKTEEREVSAGFTAHLRDAKAGLRELTQKEKERFLSVWSFVPAVRDKIKSSFKKGAHVVGGAAITVGHTTRDTSKSVAHKVADTTVGVVHKVGRGVRGIFRRDTPVSPSGTGAPEARSGTASPENVSGPAAP